MAIIERALELVPNGSRIGLGSGEAAQAFVMALGERLRNGSFRVHGVPTSEETARLARQEAVPLLTLAEAGTLDLTVDHILDCQIEPISDAPRLESDICAIPGVVGSGLFLGVADTVLVGDRDTFRLIEERRRGHADLSRT